MATYTLAVCLYGNFLNGYLDDIAIWDNALVFSEIVALYNSGTLWSPILTQKITTQPQTLRLLEFQ